MLLLLTPLMGYDKCIAAFGVLMQWLKGSSEYVALNSSATRLVLQGSVAFSWGLTDGRHYLTNTQLLRTCLDVPWFYHCSECSSCSVSGSSLAACSVQCTCSVILFLCFFLGHPARVGTINCAIRAARTGFTCLTCHLHGAC